MPYLVHIIGYLCQSLFHLLQVLTLFLILKIKLHVISGRNNNIHPHAGLFCMTVNTANDTVVTVILKGKNRHKTTQNTHKGGILKE